MSDRLRVIRDEISNGDDVLVHRNGGYTRPLVARVLKVMRGGVKVRLPDGSETTVMFKYVSRLETEPDPPPPPPAPAPAQVRAAAAHYTVQPDAAAPQEPACEVITSFAAPIVRVERMQDDVQAWLEMGRDFIPRIQSNIEAHRQMARELLAEAQELTAQADKENQSAAQLELLLGQVRIVAGGKP